MSRIFFIENSEKLALPESFARVVLVTFVVGVAPLVFAVLPASVVLPGTFSADNVKKSLELQVVIS
jgi:hypothetical protein